MPYSKTGSLPASIRTSLDLLIEGNQRFARGLRSIETIPTLQTLRELAENGQKPFAIVVACSDSRVPTEILFDRGPGDLFVIRVAGNVVTPAIIASVEYAAQMFETSLCVVMGHSKCGAVQAAIDSIDKGVQGHSPNIQSLLKRIHPAVKRAEMFQDDSRENFVNRCTFENVGRSMRTLLRKSDVLTKLKETGKFAVLGAHYDLHTGVVSFDAHEVQAVMRGA